jgi:hypothetical protein
VIEMGGGAYRRYLDFMGVQLGLGYVGTLLMIPRWKFPPKFSIVPRSYNSLSARAVKLNFDFENTFHSPQNVF